MNLHFLQRLRHPPVALACLVAVLQACSIEPPRVGGATVGTAGGVAQPVLVFQQPQAVQDPREKPTEFTVNLHTEAFKRARVGDLLTLDLPDKTVGHFRIATVSEVMVGVVSIHAKGIGQEADSLSLSFSNAAVHGQIMVGKGDWIVRTQGEKTVLIDVVGKNWQRVGPSANDVVQQLKQTTPLLEAAGNAPQRDAALSKAAEQPRATSSTLDMLVVVDLATQQSYGSTDSMNAGVANLVAIINQSLTDSLVSAQIRLTGTYLLPTALTAAQGTLLAQMNEGTAPFEQVWRQQLQAGADLVMLAIPLRPVDMTTTTTGTDTLCGVGYLGSFATSGSFGTANRSAFVTVDSSVANVRQLCGTQTPAHEMGHVMGLAHDRANAGTSVPAYSYAYGYGVAGLFGDIMAYIQPTVSRFSNPNQTQQGQPFGIADPAANSADAARALNNTSPIVQQFLDPLSRYSGWYWNPAESGTGWAVDMRNGKSFVAYFHYDDSGAPTWVAGTGADCSAGGITKQCVPLQRFSGGQTAAGPYKPITGSVAVTNLVLSFSNTFPPTATAEFGGRTAALQRFIFNSAKAIGDRPTAPYTALPQWRWDTTAPGTGVFVEHQGDQVFGAYFNYTDAGTATWQVVTGVPQNAAGTARNELRFAEYRNGQTLLGPYRTPVVSDPAALTGFLDTANDVFSAARGAEQRATTRLVRFDF